MGREVKCGTAYGFGAFVIQGKDRSCLLHLRISIKHTGEKRGNLLHDGEVLFPRRRIALKVVRHGKTLTPRCDFGRVVVVFLCAREGNTD